MENDMRGSIRAGVGFMMVFGAVGGMDADPAAPLLTLTLVAVAGLVVLASGVSAMNKNT
jgi:hypothetical protein